MNHGAGWRAAFVVSLAVNLVVLYAPDPGGPPGVPGLDKVVHAAVFAAVTWTGLRAGLPTRVLVPALVLHALVSEGVQHLLLDARTGDPLDVVADLVGMSTAWALARRPRRETMAP